MTRSAYLYIDAIAHVPSAARPAPRRRQADGSAYAVLGRIVSYFRPLAIAIAIAATLAGLGLGLIQPRAAVSPERYPTPAPGPALTAPLAP